MSNLESNLEPIPEPNPDSRTVMNQLIDGDGYAKLNGLISAATAAKVRQQILDHMEAIPLDGNGVGSAPNMLTVSADFEALVTHPTLLDLAHTLLGDDATLGAFSGRVLYPECDPGRLHVDYPYWAMNPGMQPEAPLMLQVIWMMEPFTQSNGGTWVAPGSQRWGASPETERFEANAIQATGDAGDAIVSHGLLWHRTAENHTQEPRVAVLINYTQLTIRPMVAMGPFDDAFLDRATPEMRGLLALDYGSALKKRISGYA